VSAHRNTLLGSTAAGLHLPSSARRTVFESEQNPGLTNRQEQPMQTATPITRVDRDPRSLLGVNIRTDARLDEDFVASIKDFGVLVSIKHCELQPAMCVASDIGEHLRRSKLTLRLFRSPRG
jgi:hypothetical protein